MQGPDVSKRSENWRCGRRDITYEALTAEDIEELIRQEKPLSKKQLACLKCCRDLCRNLIERKRKIEKREAHGELIERRTEQNPNTRPLNTQFIILPRSKCGGKHWRLFSGVGTNVYEVLWSKDEERAYHIKVGKTTEQAALETVHPLPNSHQARNMTCLHANAIMRAICETSAEIGRVVPRKIKFCDRCKTEKITNCRGCLELASMNHPRVFSLFHGCRQ